MCLQNKWASKQFWTDHFRPFSSPCQHGWIRRVFWSPEKYKVRTHTKVLFVKVLLPPHTYTLGILDLGLKKLLKAPLHWFPPCGLQVVASVPPPAQLAVFLERFQADSNVLWFNPWVPGLCHFLLPHLLLLLLLRQWLQGSHHLLALVNNCLDRSCVSVDVAGPWLHTVQNITTSSSSPFSSSSSCLFLAAFASAQPEVIRLPFSPSSCEKLSWDRAGLFTSLMT